MTFQNSQITISHFHNVRGYFMYVCVCCRRSYRTALTTGTWLKKRHWTIFITRSSIILNNMSPSTLNKKLISTTSRSWMKVHVLIQDCVLFCWVIKKNQLKTGMIFLVIFIAGESISVRRVTGKLECHILAFLSNFKPASKTLYFSRVSISFL